MSWADVLAVLRRLVPQQEAVCRPCLGWLEPTYGAAGDFGLCARCRQPVTSRTGVMVRKSPP